MQMTEHSSSTETRHHPLVLMAALVIIIMGLKEAAAILTPFLLALFISVAVAPLNSWLQHRRVPAGLAVFLVIALIFGALGLVGLLLGGTIAQFSESLPFYQSRLNNLSIDFVNWLRAKGVAIPADSPLSEITPGTVMMLVGNLFTQLATFLADGLLILLTIIFILLESAEFPEKMKSVLKDPAESIPRFETFRASVQRYVALKTVISIATGILIWIWMMVLGIDYAPLWGFLAFLLNYIPNIGSILAAIPAVLLALIQLGPGSAAAGLAGYLVVNNVIGNVIEPRVMGKGMGLSTLVVFISLIVWGWIFGTIGMLLSVPLTMTLKIGFEASRNSSWVSKLLSDSP
jgi:predicted PurR-regulated permease PerM